MALRNEAAASSEENMSSISESCISLRSLFLRNAFPFTPFRVSLGLLLSSSTAVNCPTVDMC